MKLGGPPGRSSGEAWQQALGGKLGVGGGGRAWVVAGVIPAAQLG